MRHLSIIARKYSSSIPYRSRRYFSHANERYVELSYITYRVYHTRTRMRGPVSWPWRGSTTLRLVNSASWDANGAPGRNCGRPSLAKLRIPRDPGRIIQRYFSGFFVSRERAKIDYCHSRFRLASSAVSGGQAWNIYSAEVSRVRIDSEERKAAVAGNILRSRKQPGTITDLYYNISLAVV